MLLIKKYYQLIGLLFAFVFILFEANTPNDFDIFYSASTDLFNNINIYEKLYAKWYHYLYSLLFTLLVYPLTFLPLYLSKLIWLGINLFFLYRIFKILRGFLKEFRFEEKETNWLLFLVFLFSLRFIRDNFHLAQMTIFILFAIIQGIKFIWDKKEIKGAALLALAINFKLLPLVILPYLFWKGYFKALSLCVFFIALYFFIPVLFLGIDKFLILVESWWGLINPTQSKHIIDTEERSFHSLTTLIPTLFMENVPDQFALPLKRNILNLSLDTVNLLVMISRIIIISLTLLFVGIKPFYQPESSIKKWRDIAYLCLSIPLIFPHQQHYAFLLTLPAVSFLFIFLFQDKKTNKHIKIIYVTTLIIIYLCFNLYLILGEFNAYYEHYKIITYGAILLVIMLILTRKINSHLFRSTETKN